MGVASIASGSDPHMTPQRHRPERADHPGGRWGADGWIGLGLACLSLALAYPFRARYLTAWDSVLFAIATEDYDLMEGHPHPPGYPVFIFLARIARALTGEANAALVIVSLLFGSASVGLFFHLARNWVSPSVAIATSVLFALSPNLVYNELVALSYTAESAIAIGLAGLAWRQRTSPAAWNAAALAAVFAFGVGMRTSAGIFLAPLALWGLLGPLGRGESIRRRVGETILGGAGVGLLWFLPMLWAGGGLGTWLATTSLQTRIVVFEFTVWNTGLSAVRDHVARITFFFEADRPTLWLTLILLVAWAVLAAAGRVAGKPPIPREGLSMRLLALWVVPALAFYTLVFSGWGQGPRGYVLVILPALYLAPALAAQAILRQWTATAPDRDWRAVFLVAVLLAPAVSLGANTRDLVQKEVADHDAWSEAWLHVREEFPPNETAILTTYSWAFVKWYFPDYTMWGHFRPPNLDLSGHWDLVLQTRDRSDDVPIYRAHLDERGVDRHPVPPTIRRIVLFDFQIAGENQGKRLLQDDIVVHEHILANGWRVLYMNVEDARPDIEAYLKLATPT